MTALYRVDDPVRSVVAIENVAAAIEPPGRPSGTTKPDVHMNGNAEAAHATA